MASSSMFICEHISFGVFVFLLSDLTSGQMIYKSTCNEELLRQVTALEKRVKILEENSRTQEPQGPDCLEGWSRFQRSCYKAFTSILNWNAAQVTCVDQGSKLVEIETLEEDQFLQKLVNDSGTRLDYWTGGVYNEEIGNWVWIVSNRNLTYTNWRPGEPNRLNDENGVEDRIEIHRTFTSYSWNDNNMAIRRYFICEKELNTN